MSLKKSIPAYCWEAMEQLLSEKSYNKISVRDICRRVGISTVTFYNYFGGKPDVFYWHVHEDGKVYYDRLSEDYTWFDYLYDVLKINLDIKNTVHNIAVNMDGQESMLEITFRSNIDLMLEYITKHYGKEVINDELMTAVRVYLYGLLIYLEKDIRAGMKTDRKSIALLLTKAMPDILKQYIPTGE